MLVYANFTQPSYCKQDGDVLVSGNFTQPSYCKQEGDILPGFWCVVNGLLLPGSFLHDFNHQHEAMGNFMLKHKGS